MFPEFPVLSCIYKLDCLFIYKASIARFEVKLLPASTIPKRFSMSFTFCTERLRTIYILFWEFTTSYMMSVLIRCSTNVFPTTYRIVWCNLQCLFTCHIHQMDHQTLIFLIITHHAVTLNPDHVSELIISNSRLLVPQSYHPELPRVMCNQIYSEQIECLPFFLLVFFVAKSPYIYNVNIQI